MLNFSKIYVHVFTNMHIYTDIPIITHTYNYTERNLYTHKHFGVLAWVASLHMSLILYLSPFFMIILCPSTFLHFLLYILLLWPFYLTSFPISCTETYHYYFASILLFHQFLQKMHLLSFQNIPSLSLYSPIIILHFISFTMYS